jgi:hypothetical protein
VSNTLQVGSCRSSMPSTSILPTARGILTPSSRDRQHV